MVTLHYSIKNFGPYLKFIYTVFIIFDLNYVFNLINIQNIRQHLNFF
jgi:hypothetical protein